MYCPNCGKEIPDTSGMCDNCGCDLKLNGKSWLATLLLCLFLGEFGIHRFYTGYIGIGIIQLLTAGGFGIWWIIDFIMILCKEYRNEDGTTLI